MSLARVKVWNPGDVLTAADLNGEFNNILNNPITLISPTTGPINFNLQAHTGLLPSVITASSGVPGQGLVASTAATSVPIFAGLVGSRVKNLRGVLTSQTGTFAADQYVMQTTNGFGGYAVNATSSYTVSVGTAGPAVNGRDIAGAFASTYVHWYAISTGPNSTAPAGLVSSNPPTVGPVALPTGYSALCYLGGSVYTSASTTVAQNHFFFGAQAAYTTAQTALTGGTSTVETSIPLTSLIPPNSLGHGGRATVTLTGVPAGTQANLSFKIAAGADFFQMTPILQAAQPIDHDTDVTFPGPTLLYQFNSTAGTQGAFYFLNRYRMPNGDV